MISVQLSKPIKVGDESFSVLDLREPTVDDVSELGYPYLLLTGDAGAAIQLQPKIILKYVARLAAIPPSSVKKVTISDLYDLQTVIMGFFGKQAQEAQPTSSDLPST